MFGPLPSEINDNTSREDVKKDVIPETREITSINSSNKNEVSDSLPSSDLSQFNRSQNSDTPNVHKCSSSTSVNKNQCSDSARSSSEGLLSSVDSELSRQISENTLDSGIHSPASEKSEALYRQGMDERLVPPFSSQAFKGLYIRAYINIQF